MDWSYLGQIVGFPRLDVFAPHTSLVARGLFRLGEDVYLYTVPHDHRLRNASNGARFVSMVLWAETEGAARRALLGEVEADLRDGTRRPPGELLPAGAAGMYGDIRAALRAEKQEMREFAEYRIATDGVFLHRVIQSESTLYYFRNDESDETERPFAVVLQFAIPRDELPQA
jgi:hypothetical protein